jgi:hypothetical protein
MGTAGMDFHVSSLTDGEDGVSCPPDRESLLIEARSHLYSGEELRENRGCLQPTEVLP